MCRDPILHTKGFPTSRDVHWNLPPPACAERSALSTYTKANTCPQKAYVPRHSPQTPIRWNIPNLIVPEPGTLASWLPGLAFLSKATMQLRCRRGQSSIQRGIMSPGIEVQRKCGKPYNTKTLYVPYTLQVSSNRTHMRFLN